MTYDYVAGDTAELTIGTHVEPVTVIGRSVGGMYTVKDSTGRALAINREALRPALPADIEVSDDVGDTVRVHCWEYTAGQWRVRIAHDGAPVDLTPDQADQLGDAVRAMARAIRGRADR